MGQITYTRGTTYNITHNYTAPQFPGVKLIFTVKTLANDDDITDLTNAVMPPKVIIMSGSSFPQSTLITINPGDVAMGMEPQDYYYSIKVVDSNNAEYIVDSGTFTLTVVPTNEITT